MKRIVTIQDISCIGRCSLTVALPVISAMGIETAVIPTAVLSTHTAFDNFTFRDLTDDIHLIEDHWKQEKIGFDAMYTGYLGSFEQLKIVSEFFNNFKTKNNIVFIDPAMADNGVLYAGFTREFALEMANLCSHADVIVPNLTEACFMLDLPYPGDDYDESYIKDILRKLSMLGAKKAVLTGVSYEKELVGAVCYDSQQDEFFEYFNRQLPVRFHGTGDIFASACIGAMMNEFSLKEAIRIAVDYTLKSIEYTMEDDNRRWYGVNFEQAIPDLVDMMREYK
ncbi:MAG: pyridoxamine kinase [Firmicutes bacterium]|nr:pyridoxamine kinase [Bacillota bacterium]